MFRQAGTCLRDLAPSRLSFHEPCQPFSNNTSRFTNHSARQWNWNISDVTYISRSIVKRGRRSVNALSNLHFNHSLKSDCRFIGSYGPSKSSAFRYTISAATVLPLADDIRPLLKKQIAQHKEASWNL